MSPGCVIASPVLRHFAQSSSKEARRIIWAGRCETPIWQRRLFRYPCSFLIYSDSFEALPAAVKDPLYQRLLEVLSGKDQSPAYQSLTAADRRAVLEILIDTKPTLPAYFRSALELAGQLP